MKKKKGFRTWENRAPGEKCEHENMKKWRKNEKMKKMKKKSRFENDEKAFFLSKEIHIVQNNLERDGANIASWIFDKESWYHKKSLEREKMKTWRTVFWWPLRRQVSATWWQGVPSNFQKNDGPLQNHPTIKQASYLERLVADGENSQCTVVGHCEQPWEIFRWKCSIFLIFQVFRKSNQNLVSCKSTARIGPSWAPWQNDISKNFKAITCSETS